MIDVHVVILTALDVEYQSIRSKLANVQVQPHPAGTRFEVGMLEDHHCRIALALVGKGNHPAAVLAERAIAQFAPAALLFVGVAGALWPQIALGDVVVATHVYAYHGGTSEHDGLKSRPRVWEISHRSDQIARHLARTGNWKRRLSHEGAAAEVHFGPIAAGEIVQDSAISGEAQWIREHYNDALAIEMEAAGVAQAGHLNNSLPVIIVRGISDRADGSKAITDGRRWQSRAAQNAAAFAAVLAGQLASDLPDSQLPRADQTGRSRELLWQAHRSGELDDPTYAAAQAELDVATEALDGRAAGSTSKLIMALKRLRGLINDVTDLAAKLATIISAVRGLV
jgi:adenosylhomocysteine nucleosidase